MQPHKVPTHMSMPDKLVFGLTTRQLLITLIGGGIGYDIWIHLYALMKYGLIGLIARLALSLTPAALALVLALVSIAGLPLEVWALVLLRYLRQPKTYVWRSVRSFPRRVEPEADAERDTEVPEAMASRVLKKV